jgi:hypothetical protein
MPNLSRRLFSLLIAAAFCSGCQSRESTIGEYYESEGSLKEMYLSPEEIKAYSADALSGDGAAAYFLHQHYAFCTTNMEEAERWLELSASLDFEIAVSGLAAVRRNGQSCPKSNE